MMMKRQELVSEDSKRAILNNGNNNNATLKQRVGMNHAAFGACELGRQLRQKKLQELKQKAKGNPSSCSGTNKNGDGSNPGGGPKSLARTHSFNRMRSSYSKQRPLFMEMLVVERGYVDSLHVVVSRFMLPLQVALENFPVPIITKKEISTIFGNIAQLFEVNMELLRIIEHNLGIQDAAIQQTEKTDDNDLATAFAEAFTNMLPVFRAFYGVYVCNYEQSIDMLEELRQSNFLFRKFLEIAAKHEDCKGLDLCDYLIKPVQQICRYPLFFSSLLDCTEKTHKIYGMLQSASAAVAKIADQVNQTGKENENAMRSFEIANQLEGLEKYDPNLHVVAPGRRFVHEFECKVHYSFQTPGAKPTKEMRHAPYKKKPRECFLFTDALVIAKSIGEKLEFRFWLALDDVLVTIPPSHSSSNSNPASAESKTTGGSAAGGGKDEEDEPFSAAQKRMPLDIVRIRIVKNEKVQKKSNKPKFEKPVSHRDINSASPNGSFSSSSSRSLECSESKNNTNNTGSPCTTPNTKPFHKRSSSATAQAEFPLVEKYTLWFKTAKERTKVYQLICNLQKDLEQKNMERETHINQQKSLNKDAESNNNAKPPTHKRSFTHNGVMNSATSDGVAPPGSPATADAPTATA